MSCETTNQPWQFVACTTYGDSYLTAMSQYVCNLRNWNIETQGIPPSPHPPSETYAGAYPTPPTSPNPPFTQPTIGRSFMQGYMNNYPYGAQMGAIRLQNARNQAYGVALSSYYAVMNRPK